MRASRNGRNKRAMWIGLGAVAGTAVAASLAVVIYSSVNSVSVTFINDTAKSVVLPDCGQDIATVAAKSSLVIHVFQSTAHCSIDIEGPSGEIVGGCLRMPSPLQNGDVVRVSQASPDLKRCT
jgi:hypothetical protein